MTTTEITNIAHLLELDAYYGDYADDYDTDAIRADYVDALNDLAGDGVIVTASGLVYADLDYADQARDIDWRELAESIDLDPIAFKHAR